MGTKKRMKRTKKSKRQRGGEYVNSNEYQYKNPMNSMNNSNDTDTFDENELYVDRHGPIKNSDFGVDYLSQPETPQQPQRPRQSNNNYIQTSRPYDNLSDQINDYNSRCSGMFKTKSADCLSKKGSIESAIDNNNYSRQELHSIYQQTCPKKYGIKNTSSLCKKLDSTFTSLPTANSRMSFNYDFTNPHYQNMNSRFPPELDEEETNMLSRGNGGKRKSRKSRKTRKSRK
jgi:hypothetical protein